MAVSIMRSIRLPVLSFSVCLRKADGGAGHEEETAAQRSRRRSIVAVQICIAYGRADRSRMAYKRIGSCLAPAIVPAWSWRRKMGQRVSRFCCISTGEFHFPNDKAAEIAIKTVKEYKKRTGQQGSR